MGMTAGGGGKSKRAMADINVTPMVDAMLVLLVIFMITAPVIKQIDALQVKLPVLAGQPAETILTEDARTLEVHSDGSVVKAGTGGQETNYDSMAQLVTDLKAYKDESAKEKKQAVVVIAGDRDTKWERIMQVWNSAKTAGITQISFQVEASGKTAEDETESKPADAAGKK